MHAYHADVGDGSVTLDLVDNLGLLIYGSRVSSVGVVLTDYYDFGSDPSEKYWEYRVLGHGAAGVIYAWAQETDDHQHTLTMWGTPDAPYNECHRMALTSATLRENRTTSVPFTIPGAYDVPANTHAACPSFVAHTGGLDDDRLRADCTGKVAGFEMVVYGQNDFSNSAAAGMESIVFLSDGEDSCVGTLWLYTGSGSGSGSGSGGDGKTKGSELDIWCFDGKQKMGDGNALEQVLAQRIQTVQAIMPDWFYAAHNMTKPSHG